MCEALSKYGDHHQQKMQNIQKIRGQSRLIKGSQQFQLSQENAYSKAETKLVFQKELNCMK